MLKYLSAAEVHNTTKAILKEKVEVAIKQQTEIEGKLLNKYIRAVPHFYVDVPNWSYWNCLYIIKIENQYYGIKGIRKEMFLIKIPDQAPVRFGTKPQDALYKIIESHFTPYKEAFIP